MTEFMPTNMSNTTEQLASSENNTKKRKKQKTKKKAIEGNDGVQARIQKDDSLETSEKTNDSKVAHVDSENSILQTSLNVQPLASHLKLDSGSTEILTDVNKDSKKRKRTKKINALVTDDILSTDINVQSLNKHSEMDLGSAENLSDGNKASKSKKKKKKAEVEEQKIKDDIQSTDQTMTDAGSTIYTSESEKKKMKEHVTDEILSTDINVHALAKHTELDSGSAENIFDGNKASKKKSKKKKKAEVEEQNIKDDTQSTYQTMTDTCSITYISESDTKKMKTHVTDESLSLDMNSKHSGMDSGSAENLSDGNKTTSKKKRKKKKKAEVEEENIKDDIQSTDQIMTGTGPVTYISESNNNLLATDLNVEPLAKKPEIYSGSVEILSHGNKVSEKKRKKKNKAEVEDENQSMCRAKVMDDRGSIEVKDENQSTVQILTDARPTIYISEPENNLLEATLDVQPVSKHSVIPGSMENISEGNKVSKKKSKKKKKENTGEEIQSMNVSKMDTGSTEYQKLAKIEEEINIVDQANAVLNLHVLGEIDGCNGSIENLDQLNVKSKKKKKKTKNKVENTDDIHIVDQVGALSTLPTVNLVEGNLVQETAKVKDEVQSMVRPKAMDRGSVEGKDENQSTDQIMTDARSTIYISEPANNLLEATLDVQPVSKHSVIPGSMENISEGNEVSKKKSKKKKKANAEEENQSMNVTKMDTGTTECPKLAKVEEEIHIVDQANAILNLHVLGEIDGCNGSMENLDQVNVKSKTKKKKNKNKVENKDDVHILDQVGAMSNLPTVNLVEGNHVQKTEKVKDEVQSMVQPKLTLHSDLSTESHKQGIDDKVTENQYTAQLPRLAVTAPVRRKLLVLDVNGLLADIVMPAPKDCRGDIHMLGRAIFKRPFFEDFMEFCFQNFDVGIWSSRSWRVIDHVVGYLFGSQRNKLLFVWDMSCCTQTRFKTLENKFKPLVCKGLQEIWNADYPNLPWKKGDYDETNTLLLDDSPYKALLNPLHTAVFPSSYTYQMKNDTSLGPGGDLRVYLEGLITFDNVQKYVEQHPFGEAAIEETHPSWEFYAEVLRSLSSLSTN